MEKTDYLPIDLPGLYAEAVDVGERQMLLSLAKRFHIRKENFEESLRLRELERQIANSATEALHNIGKNLL